MKQLNVSALREILTNRLDAARAARIFTWLCIAFAAVASGYMFAARFFHLTNGLQYDELYSAITASPKLPLGFVWKNMLWQDINLPLYNILLFVWNRIFPYTYVSMRLFSALTGALAVVMAWVCAPAYWTRLKKYIFVSLVACSFILVGYGAIVRTYSLAVLVSVVFSLLALRFIDAFSRGETPSRRAWLTFFTVGLIGSYCHFFCTGVFFITALVVFLYACYYKVGRAWAFWGTAVVFGLWSFWLWHVVVALRAVASGNGWWFKTPFVKATFDILRFLFGEHTIFVGLLYGLVLSGVSLISTYKTKLFKQADIILPLAQIVLLLGVVAVASCRVNLWLDRYFLPLMPAFILLFAGCLDHLRQRHVVLLILWPVLLTSWVWMYHQLAHLEWPEYTGLQDAFTYLTKTHPVDKVLVDMERTGYPMLAFRRMLAFYIPPDSNLQMIPFTAQTAHLSWETNPKTLVMLPLCSQIHLIYSSGETRTEPEEEPKLFGRDTCIYTVRPVKPKKL